MGIDHILKYIEVGQKLRTKKILGRLFCENIPMARIWEGVKAFLSRLSTHSLKLVRQVVIMTTFLQLIDRRYDKLNLLFTLDILLGLNGQMKRLSYRKKYRWPLESSPITPSQTCARPMSLDSYGVN